MPIIKRRISKLWCQFVSSNDWRFWRNLGVVYEVTQVPVSAIETYQSGLEVLASSLELLYNLIMILETIERRYDYTRALKIAVEVYCKDETWHWKEIGICRKNNLLM